VRCMICSDAERRGVEGNFSILVPRFADHRTDLQHWHAASAFYHEGPLNTLRLYNCMLWAILVTVSPRSAVRWLFCCSVWFGNWRRFLLFTCFTGPVLTKF
jgi:hypothetical protein